MSDHDDRERPTDPIASPPPMEEEDDPTKFARLVRQALLPVRMDVEVMRQSFENFRFEVRAQLAPILRELHEYKRDTDRRIRRLEAEVFGEAGE